MFRKTAHWYLKAMRSPVLAAQPVSDGQTRPKKSTLRCADIETHGPIGGDRTGVLPDLAVPVPSGPVERW